MKTIFFLLTLTSSLFIQAEELPNLKSQKNPLIIDPNLRALDYQQVFEALRKEKPSNKVCIQLLNGAVLSNIIELQKMANNTLFLVRTNSPQGIKLQAVELELIQSIGYLE